MAAIEESPKAPAWTLRGAVAPGIDAVKGHWLTFLVIQGCGAAFVIAYYRTQAIRDVAAELADFKVRWGLLFAFLAMFAACCILPEIAKLLTGKLRTFDRAWASKSLFTGLVYGVVGIQVDVFYTYQGVWFGTGTDPKTFLLKTLVDMALFSTIISIPTAILAFEWRKRGFRWRALQSELSWVFYRDRILPALIPCWAFWTPVLFCSYSMPMNLQFCFTMFAEGAWSLLFVFIATRDD